MKSRYILLIAILSLLSCSEWEPVLYAPSPPEQENLEKNIEVTRTIADLKNLYKGKALVLSGGFTIKGQVITSDQEGNFYKSLYIQDESAGIEIKIGKPGLYNDYKRGQWLYIMCDSLTLGGDNGMISLGYKSTNEKYQTAHLEASAIIDQHIIKANIAELPAPKNLSGEQIKDPKYLGTLVSIPNCVYKKEIFAIINYSATRSKNERVFLSQSNYGINTWSMSKTALISFLEKGNLDKKIDKEKRKAIEENIAHVSIFPFNQYFSTEGVDFAVNTSSFARFADTAMPQALFNAEKTATLSGILTRYNDKIQLLLVDADMSSVQVENLDNQ